MKRKKQLWSYSFTPDYNEAERRLACVQQHTPLRKHVIFFVDLLKVRM